MKMQDFSRLSVDCLLRGTQRSSILKIIFANRDNGKSVSTGGGMDAD